MRDTLISDLFHHLSKRLSFPFDSAPSAIEQKVEALPLPMDVKRLLQWHWPRAYAFVGPYDLAPAEAILEHHDLTRLLQAQMVPVGSARNGDILVIRFDQTDRAEIGLICHDALWEDPQLNPIEAFSPVASSVEEFLYRAVEDRFLPIDSYSAEELHQMVSELNKRGGA